MSNAHQNFSAGQARAEGMAKADEWMESARSGTGSMQARRPDAAQSAHETGEQAAGLLQQTGEQIKQMAQGAVEAAKNTLGVGDGNNNINNNNNNNNNNKRI